MAQDSPNQVIQASYQAEPVDYVDQPEAPEPSGAISGAPIGLLPNYANDSLIVDQIKLEILPKVQKARSNRKAKVEDNWSRYRDIYACRRTISFYEGRSKLFIPAIKKAVDTLTRIAKDSILSDPYVAIETDVDRWRDVGIRVIRYLLEDQGNIRQVMSMFLRQLYQIGTSCIKFEWLDRKRIVTHRQTNELGESEIVRTPQYDHCGPLLTVVDMSHVYVYPETAIDYENASIVFEDMVSNATKLRAKARSGWYNPEAVERVIAKRSVELEQDKQTVSTRTKEMGADEVLDEEQLDITEIWARLKLPGNETGYGDDENPAWVWITIAGEEILRVVENPWWFQTPPYLFGAIFREHDYFYGHGIIESLEMWSYMLNDIINQTVDCGTFSLNPIALMDPMAIDDPDMYQIEPSAKWLIDPQAVKFDRPPAQMSIEGMNLARWLLNVIQESSDATAIVQGAPREGLGRAAGTATGVSQLAAAATGAIIDQVEDLETQVFTRLLKMTEIAAHQYLTKDNAIRLAGPDAISITDRVIEPEDLTLSRDIRWIASRRLREKLAKGQQLLNFFNIAVGVPSELTLQQGFMIDFKELTKAVYAGMGLDNPDSIIKDVIESVPGIPPEYEYELAVSGRRVVASRIEDINTHLLKIRALQSMPQPQTDFARQRLNELIASHYSTIQTLQQIQAAQAQQQAAGQGAAVAPTGPGSMGGADATPPQVPATGGGFPVRPQNMGAGEFEGNELQGLLSQVGLE